MSKAQRRLLSVCLPCVIVGLTFAGCATWRSGWTLHEYQGRVLPVKNGGAGAKRLQIESECDPTVREFVGENGEPDYISVADLYHVQLIYIGEHQRVVLFERPSGWSWKSHATVTEGIPDDLVAHLPKPEPLCGGWKCDDEPATPVAAEPPHQPSPEEARPPEPEDEQATHCRICPDCASCLGQGPQASRPSRENNSTLQKFAQQREAYENMPLQDRCKMRGHCPAVEDETARLACIEAAIQACQTLAQSSAAAPKPAAGNWWLPLIAAAGAALSTPSAGGAGPIIGNALQAAAGQATPKLMVFGGPSHQVYLGCVNCPQDASDSIFNQDGSNGSEFAEGSIRNPGSQYGSGFSMYSACNPAAADPPVIVNAQGVFFGRLIVNRLHPQVVRDEQLLEWLEQVACQ